MLVKTKVLIAEENQDFLDKKLPLDRAKALAAQSRI